MTEPTTTQRESYGPEVAMWFVSDVHLVDGDQPYLEQFLAFLARAGARGIDQLWIFGDLFEFWIGDRQGKTDFYAPLFAAIRGLVASGVRVRIIHGNRDFLLGSIFTKVGAEILPDEVLLELAGRRVHLSHGDQFCIHDRSYQRARVIFRSGAVFTLSRILPAWLGSFLARSYRGISERKKARKKMVTGNRFHTIEDGLLAEFRSGDHDAAICGHIHFYAETRLEVEGRERLVYTTDAWEEGGPNFLAFEEGRLELRRFSVELPESSSS